MLLLVVLYTAHLRLLHSITKIDSKKKLVFQRISSYLWLLVDLRVHVKTLRVEHDDVALPDSH